MSNLMDVTQLHQLRVGFSFALEALFWQLQGEKAATISDGEWAWCKTIRFSRTMRIPNPYRMIKDRFAKYCDDLRIIGESREQLRKSLFSGWDKVQHRDIDRHSTIHGIFTND